MATSYLTKSTFGSISAAVSPAWLVRKQVPATPPSSLTISPPAAHFPSVSCAASCVSDNDIKLTRLSGFEWLRGFERVNIKCFALSGQRDDEILRSNSTSIHSSQDWAGSCVYGEACVDAVEQEADVLSLEEPIHGLPGATSDPTVLARLGCSSAEGRKVNGSHALEDLCNDRAAACFTRPDVTDPGPHLTAQQAQSQPWQPREGKQLSQVLAVVDEQGEVMDVLFDKWNVRGVDVRGPRSCAKQYMRVCTLVDGEGRHQVLCEEPDDGVEGIDDSIVQARGTVVQNYGDLEKQGARNFAQNSAKGNESWMEERCRSALEETDGKDDDDEGDAAMLQAGRRRGLRVCSSRAVRAASDPPGRYLFVSEDGEGFTSVDVAANGLSVVCNNRGCRPVRVDEVCRLQEVLQSEELLIFEPQGMTAGPLSASASSPSASHYTSSKPPLSPHSPPSNLPQPKSSQTSDAHASIASRKSHNDRVAGKSMVVEPWKYPYSPSPSPLPPSFPAHLASKFVGSSSAASRDSIASDAFASSGSTDAAISVSDSNEPVRHHVFSNSLASDSQPSTPLFPLPSPSPASPASVHTPTKELPQYPFPFPRLQPSPKDPAALRLDTPAAAVAVAATAAGATHGRDVDMQHERLDVRSFSCTIETTGRANRGGQKEQIEIGGGADMTALMEEWPAGRLRGVEPAVGQHDEWLEESTPLSAGCSRSNSITHPAFKEDSADTGEAGAAISHMLLGARDRDGLHAASSIAWGGRGQHGAPPYYPPANGHMHDVLEWPMMEGHAVVDGSSSGSSATGGSRDVSGEAVTAVLNEFIHRREGGGGRGVAASQLEADRQAGVQSGEQRQLTADEWEEEVVQALEEEPWHPLLLRNYVRFLMEVRLNDWKAEEVVQQALSSSQSSEWRGEVLAHYARVVWEVRHDAAKAMNLYEAAVEAAPGNCYVLAAYASFLWSMERAAHKGSESDRRRNPQGRSNVSAS